MIVCAVARATTSNHAPALSLAKHKNACLSQDFVASPPKRAARNRRQRSSTKTMCKQVCAAPHIPGVSMERRDVNLSFEPQTRTRSSVKMSIFKSCSQETAGTNTIQSMNTRSCACARELAHRIATVRATSLPTDIHVGRQAWRGQTPVLGWCALEKRLLRG